MKLQDFSNRNFRERYIANCDHIDEFVEGQKVGIYLVID